MKEMIMLIPQYIKDFKCIGSDCEDSCCTGWKVTIDELTYKKYKKLSNYEMRKKLVKYVGRDRTSKSKADIAKMRLQNNTCPFLQENKLCEIHGSLGEEYLSNTCAIYPRLNKKVDNVMEEALTLSCPEAARLILLCEEPIQFEQGERAFTTRELSIDHIQTNKLQNTWKSHFWDMRIFTISLLQNRLYTLEERLFILGLVYKNLEQAVEKKEIHTIPNMLEKYNKNITEGLYQGVLKDIPKAIEIQLKFCKELVDIKTSMGMGSERYSKCLIEILLGLNFNEDIALEESARAYQEGYEQYYKPFIDKHGYMLENYLVNYVFANHMPIDQKTPFESYVRLIVHYAIIKLHLVGQASYHKELTSEKVVQTIQMIAKTFEHNKVYFNQILSLIADNEYMDLAHMAILIKN